MVMGRHWKYAVEGPHSLPGSRAYRLEPDLMSPSKTYPSGLMLPHRPTLNVLPPTKQHHKVGDQVFKTQACWKAQIQTILCICGNMVAISHMWCCLGQKVKHKAGHLEKGMNVLSYLAVFSFWAQLSYMLPRAGFYTGTTAEVTPITVLGLPDSNF